MSINSHTFFLEANNPLMFQKEKRGNYKSIIAFINERTNKKKLNNCCAANVITHTVFYFSANSFFFWFPI